MNGPGVEWRTLHPLEIDADDFLHRLFPFAGCIHQLPIPFDEEIQTIGLECFIDKRTFDIEMSLDEVKRGTNFRELNPVTPANRSQNMRLDKIDERQKLPLRIVQMDQGPGSLRSVRQPDTTVPPPNCAEFLPACASSAPLQPASKRASAEGRYQSRSS